MATRRSKASLEGVSKVMMCAPRQACMYTAWGSPPSGVRGALFTARPGFTSKVPKRRKPSSSIVSATCSAFSSGMPAASREAVTAGAIVVILAAVVLAVDQFTKYLALQHLPLEQPVHVIGNFLIFFRITNSGAAFSIGENVTWLFTIALAVVALVIIWLVGTRVRSRAWAIILGLLLGGVLGNLTDRLIRGPGHSS